MARRLRGYVHVGGTAYGPDDELPDAVAAQIGDHAWADDFADAELQGESGPETVGFTDPRADRDRSGAVEAPPRSGRGSGIDAWRQFAEQNGVDTDDEMSRDDVIAAVESAGVIEPEQPKE
jgi:hypothetical protein